MNFKYPVNYIAITQEFSDKHSGLDLGWNSNYGGKNQPIYSAEDGIVNIVIDNNRNKDSWGNYLKIEHGNNYYTLYGHLKNGIMVNKGDLIGYMGNTGNANGEHLHFEVYEGGSTRKFRVNPLSKTYVYEGQIVLDSSKKKVLYFKTIKKHLMK